jgi:hypothetical protein
MQSAPITSKVVSSNPVHCEVYSIQHYVIKFVREMRQIGGFLGILRFPQPIKLTATIQRNCVESSVSNFDYQNIAKISIRLANYFQINPEGFTF